MPAASVNGGIAYAILSQQFYAQFDQKYHDIQKLFAHSLAGNLGRLSL